MLAVPCKRSTLHFLAEPKFHWATAPYRTHYVREGMQVQKAVTSPAADPTNWCEKATQSQADAAVRSTKQVTRQVAPMTLSMDHLSCRVHFKALSEKPACLKSCLYSSRLKARLMDW